MTRSARPPRVWPAAFLALLAATVAFAQDERPVPAFRSQADAITVDAVVLDKEGRPVRGLTKDDFTLLEDGRPQAIVGFEARELTAAAKEPPPAIGLADESMATNEMRSPRGRTLAFLLDDLGTQVLVMEDTKKTLRRWLAEKADPRDQVTLATTSGDVWWSDIVGSGRADLEAVLGRIRGRKPNESAKDFMSDWEAYRIAVWEDRTGAAAESAGPSGGGGGSAGGPPAAPGPAQNAGLGGTLARVVGRWGSNHACFTSAECTQVIEMRANELYAALGRRVQAVLRMVERLSQGLAGMRGRKSILVFSEGFLNDTQQRGIDRTIDASRRANTAVYFIDSKGLAGLSIYGADQPSPPAGSDVGIMTMEEDFLETAGTESLAENTGGASIRHTNDLVGGVERVAQESAVYYLLGYQPEKMPDGKWHKVEVKVARPGVKIRSRQGYQATPPPAPEAPPKARREKGPKKGEEKPKGPKRALDPAVMVADDDAIPLRLAPYILETDKTGLARVLVALEVGMSSLAPAGAAQPRKVSLDLTLLGISRDQAKTFPLDERAEFDVGAQAGGGWLSLSREILLPAGVAQVRALVRDVDTGRAGTVAQRIEVPALDKPYLSSPILTDQLLKRQGLRPVAHRRFRAPGPLYCMYEVIGMTDAQGLAAGQVAGGFSLQTAAGRVVSSAEPTPIAVSLEGRVIRVMGIPLDGLEDGDYRLVIEVLDRASGRTLQSTEAFTLGSEVASAR